MHCLSCGTEAQEAQRFCGQCGSALQDNATEQTAERRQITVLFCDLVGSTLLADQLDPEELREVVRAYQSSAGEVVQRFEGHVAQYLGDGLLIYFGYPTAHEDDARRAILTGLGILNAVADLRRRLSLPSGTRLDVRLGIHTGTVVTGEVGGGSRRERLALGQAPNIAARLQSLAEPGTLVMSAATQRLVRGFFDHDSLGMQTLKGISQPIEVFRVLRENTAESPVDQTLAQRAVTLVGREKELAVLSERLEEARKGHGQVVTISGEPGIGKSRLVQMFRERVDTGSLAWLTCRCSAFHENSAFYPFIELTEKALSFRRDEPATAKLEKLRHELDRRGISHEEALPLLAEFLAIPFDESSSITGLSPQRRKERVLELLWALIANRAGTHPVVFLMEDLHWIDPSSLELLHLLVERAASTQILLLLIHRPAFEARWTARGNWVQVSVERLTEPEAVLLVRGITGGRELPQAVLEKILEKTDGVPLFIEELTSSILESGLLQEKEGADPLPDLAIPTTLQDSLMARLDRLKTAKELAQLGAVLGRQFTYEMLLAISLIGEARLQQDLSRLVRAGLLYQRGWPPSASYFFKHALIQDAAYASLLKSTRREYHQRIAQTLVERFSDFVENRAEILAHHYTQAEQYERAVEYWLRAGQRAAGQSANLEAIHHLRRGLDLLATLPETTERNRTELTLQMALAPAICAVRGYGAPEVEQAYERAQRLCCAVGEASELFWALRGLGAFRLIRADHRQALRFAESMLELAEGQQPAVMLVWAHFGAGISNFFLGELATSLEELEESVSTYSLDRDRSFIQLAGDDTGVTARCFAAFASWILGFPDKAARYGRDAIELARQLDHPFSLAFALAHTSLLHLFLREPRISRERAEEATAIATEKGFVAFMLMANFALGGALEQERRSATAPPEVGESGEGLNLMLQGLNTWRGVGARAWQTFFLCSLAEAHLERGLLEEARRLVDEALSASEQTEERFWQPELLRVAGELALADDGAPQGESQKRAESFFLQALGVAQQQGARMLELRAATSLSRLWQHQDRPAQARELLTKVLASISEGLETPDIQEATAQAG